MDEGAAMMKQLALDAGFQHAEIVPTKGHPSVFATLDAGAKKTLGLYFMYDVKQADPAEWSSPPWDAKLLDMPGKGKVLMGRAATNQKGPQAAFLAAMHAIRGAGKKLPVNLVLVAEGEEEVGSPNFKQVCHDTPHVRAALEKCVGIFMPSHSQDSDGSVAITLGSKGDIECDLVASGEKWGRGPTRDVHSSIAAALDQPAWHLVQALNTLVTAEGDPAVDGFFEHARPVTPEERAMIDIMAQRMDEKSALADIGAKVWARKADWRQSIEDYVSRPTLTIEGLVGGYGGPGGKTDDAAQDDGQARHAPGAEHDARGHHGEAARAPRQARLRRHRNHQERRLQLCVVDARRLEAHPGRAARVPALRHRPNDAAALRRLLAGLRVHRCAAQAARRPFRPGLRRGAHAPDEYCLIESTNPKLHGMNDLVRSYVDYLYELAS